MPEPINDTWLSGKPYYCERCGLGKAEFTACEEAGCEMESEAKALARLERAHADRADACKRQVLIVPDWHSIPIEVAQGQKVDLPRSGKKAPDGIAIAATQLGEGGEVVLMLGLSKDELSLAGVLTLDEWNRLQALFQLALIDAAALQRAKLDAASTPLDRKPN